MLRYAGLTMMLGCVVLGLASLVSFRESRSAATVLFTTTTTESTEIFGDSPMSIEYKTQCARLEHEIRDE